MSGSRASLRHEHRPQAARDGRSLELRAQAEPQPRVPLMEPPCPRLRLGSCFSSRSPPQSKRQGGPTGVKPALWALWLRKILARLSQAPLSLGPRSHRAWRRRHGTAGEGKGKELEIRHFSRQASRRSEEQCLHSMVVTVLPPWMLGSEARPVLTRESSHCLQRGDPCLLLLTCNCTVSNSTSPRRAPDCSIWFKCCKCCEGTGSHP